MAIGTWEPLWLDEPSRCLYAAMHPAAPGAFPGALPGVLIVPPLLHEQPRSRRFVTEVASGLAAMGMPCLRFDFFGTGDSDGTGDQLDFASMHRDLDLANAVLRARTGVDAVVVLGWRAAALPLRDWLRDRRPANLLVLWEPLADGQRWLADIEREDAIQRRQRPRPRPGVPRLTDPDDGQLMGFAASSRLRRDLAQTRLAADAHAPGIPTWAVLHPQAPSLPIEVARTFLLPPAIPTFTGGTDMEATFFLSPLLERVVNELGRALVDELGRALLEQEFR